MTVAEPTGSCIQLVSPTVVISGQCLRAANQVLCRNFENSDMPISAESIIPGGEFLSAVQVFSVKLVSLLRNG